MFDRPRYCCFLFCKYNFLFVTQYEFVFTHVKHLNQDQLLQDHGRESFIEVVYVHGSLYSFT